MEQTYKIVGIHSEQGCKKLCLVALENMMQKQETVDPLAALNALKNMSGLVQKTSEMYLKQKQVDHIRVPDSVFKEKQLAIDETFTINY